MPTYDYIIIGTGIAGLYTALLAQRHGTVLLITKGSIEETNTKYAQGGIAAAIGRDDSFDLHLKDTLDAGAGLCDPETVRILVEEAPDRIQDLVAFGVPFDTVHGEIALTREGAHSRDRILHAGGDATGLQIELSLGRELSLSRLARMSRVSTLENVLLTDIIVENGRAKGIRAVDVQTGVARSYEGRFIVLATGGCGRLFRYTTNSPVATGDGVALAYNAGADIKDMEFYQFHPTALSLPGAPPFLISEAVRGEGAILRDPEGRAFAKDYDPRGEMAPRDIVSRAILSEMHKHDTEHVYLDVTHLPPSATSVRFPTIYRTCLDHGVDITKEWVPVSPAAHYMIGGVATNTWGETTLPGLFACGETACTGVHGANRLASNSLLETLIFGKRLVLRTAAIAKGQGDGNGIPKAEAMALSSHVAPTRPLPDLSRTALQNLLWDKVGIVRNGPDLTEAVETLFGWAGTMRAAQDPRAHELSNMLLTSRIMAEAALARRESRGAHWRTDYPSPSDQWLRHITFRKAEA